jgi:hypothetical protein
MKLKKRGKRRKEKRLHRKKDSRKCRTELEIELK